MRVVLLHGTGGNSCEAFFPWLSETLVGLGHQVVAPDFPDSSFPNRELWVQAVLGATEVDEETVLIGRSLGGTLIPHLLEAVKRPVKASFLIAPPHADLGWENLKPFFEKPFSIEQTKRYGGKIHLWFSDDDPHVPLEHAEMFAKDLGVKPRIFHHVSHFYMEEFPELLEAVRKVL